MNDVSYLIIRKEEGYSASPYYCIENYPTVGIGQRIGPKSAPLHRYEFSVSEAVARVWCQDHIAKVRAEIQSRPSTNKAYRACNEIRQAVMINMAYQMGVFGLSLFKQTLAYLEDERWEDAAEESLDSLYAKRTTSRALRNAAMIRTGILDKYYEAQ